MYDLFYADKPYEEEAVFVDGCIKEWGARNASRLLELACGTGKHARQFARLGYHVLATDYSEDMIRCARERSVENPDFLDFKVRDMRQPQVNQDSYDAVVCLFDSIGYVQTNEAVMTVLRSAHQALAKGGVFVVEFWHAAAMLRDYDPVRVRKWAMEDRSIIRISETELLPADQLAKVSYSVYELFKNGLYNEIKETQVNRYFLVPEMDAYLRSAGFSQVHFSPAYNRAEKISEKTWHIIAVAVK